MGKSPTISIITPVFNTNSIFLEELWENISAQSLQDFEWIIINDGSTDPQLIELIFAIKNKEVKARIIHHEINQGLSAARNSGIKQAKGSFFFFIDADDKLAETFLEKGYLFLSANDEFAFVNSYVRGFGAQNYYWQGGFHQNEMFLKENRNTSCFMARKSAFDHLLFDETLNTGCEDWDFWLHAATKGLWGYTIPEYLFSYRRSTETKWQSLSSTKRLESERKKLITKYGGVLKIQGFPNPKLRRYKFGVPPQSMSVLENFTQINGKHIICFFPWLQTGGADYFNFRLLKGLKEKGWHFTIITTKKSNNSLQDDFQLITKDIFHLNNLGNESSFAAFIKYLIKSRKPSRIFLSNSMYAYFLLPWMKQEFQSLPFIDFIHSEDPGWYNGGYPYFSALYSSFIDRTFVTSNNLKNICIQNGSDAKKIKVAYINIDTNTIKRNPNTRNELRGKLALSDTDILILYVARLTEQKQPLVLLEVLANLRKLNRNYKCVIIGDGPDKEKLLQLLTKLQLNDIVNYLGELPNKDVLDYMSAADIFFLPSLYEGIALSIYEAMANELAVVGANTGGQSELVTEDCGILVDLEEGKSITESYTTALASLVQNISLIKNMGMNGRKRVETNFQFQKLIEEMNQSLGETTPGIIETHAFQQANLLVTERMMFLERKNQDLLEVINTKPIQFLIKHKKSYQKLRKYWHRTRRILKNQKDK